MTVDTEQRLAALEKTVAHMQAGATAGSQAMPRMPGLDMSQVYARTEPAVGPGQPYGSVALVSESHEINSFAWPLLVFIHASDHPQASIGTSQSCGTDVMAFSNGSGSAWLTGQHVEIHHGKDFWGKVNADAAGTTIGQNIEISRDSSKGYVVGLEINTLGPLPADAGIDFQGKYKAAINLRDQAIVTDGGWTAGGWTAWTDSKGKVAAAMGYNRAKDRIEMWRAGRLVQSW